MLCNCENVLKWHNLKVKTVDKLFTDPISLYLCQISRFDTLILGEYCLIVSEK